MPIKLSNTLIFTFHHFQLNFHWSRKTTMCTLSIPKNVHPLLFFHFLVCILYNTQYTLTLTYMVAYYMSKTWSSTFTFHPPSLWHQNLHSLYKCMLTIICTTTITTTHHNNTILVCPINTIQVYTAVTAAASASAAITTHPSLKISQQYKWTT